MDGDGKKEFPPPVDLCKMSPLERQKVRTAWLAAPKSYHFDEGPVTLVRRTPFGLSLPALRAKCSPHTELLAVARNPLPPMHYMTIAEREMQREMEEEMTKEELRWLKKKSFVPTPTGVKKSALTAKITPRVEAMALARLCILNDTRAHFFSKLSSRQRKALLGRINEHYNIFYSNYPPEADKVYVMEGGAMIHAGCSSKPQDKGPRLRYICELNKNQRKAFRKRMKLLGLPKKEIIPDGGPDRGPKKKLKDFEPWMTIISQPRYNLLSEPPYNPFKVSPAAKYYVATEKILLMARPKEPPPPPPLKDRYGNDLPPRKVWSYEGLKRIVASARTIELAMPKFVKKKEAEDLKDDPFAVPRRALRAYCSPRTVELAEPRRR